MCLFKTGIIVKDRLIMPVGVDNHEKIIKDNNIGDKTSNPLFVRVEIIPDWTDFWNFPLWKFIVDQDILPGWWDAKYAEKQCRDWVEKNIKPDNLKVGGSLYLSGCTGLKALPDNLKVGGSLYLSGCTGLKHLKDKKIKGVKGKTIW